MNTQSTGEIRPKSTTRALAETIARKRFTLIRNGDTPVSMPFAVLVDLLEEAIKAGRTAQAKDQEASRPGKADLLASLETLLGIVQRHPGTGGARVIASALCSLYDGHRCKVDLTDLRLLDRANFEHVLNVLRLDHAPAREVHEYIENGGAIWEAMIADYGFGQGGDQS